MPEFTYPDYLPEGFDPSSNSTQTGGFEPSPPPDTTRDDDGVDRALNGFIADKQAILYDGDAAFHGKTGYDALEAAPAVDERLLDLRQEALDNAPNDYQRTVLGERLDAQLDEARDGIGRRLEQADTEAQLQTIDDRYGMLRAEAAYDHNDPDKIEGLATAAAQAAEHEARLSDHDDPESLATERRNGVYRSAIEANLAKGQPREALALYDRSKGSLGPVLTTEMKDLATDVEAEDWVRRQEGAPTQETADAALADPDLSPAARLRAYQKVQAEIVGTENARVAEVERLDVALASTTKTLATNPSNFKRGTLASLADGYQKADETDTAAMLRAQAEQESFLRGYAQSPAQAQQRILDTLPESVDRTLLEQIGKHQAEAFDKDPWIAGTAIYPDVGAPKPGSDFPGRINQARLIAQHRGGIEVLPFSRDEIATLRKNIPAAPPKEQTDTLKELATLPPEILPPLASALVGKNGSDDFQSRSLGGALSFHADGAPEIADQVLRGARLTQEKGDAGEPVTATTDAWKDALRERIGDGGPVPPIVRDTIANIYTHNAERAGQGGEIDHDLLDKAIDITKDNIARQPEIMQARYDISPPLAVGGDKDLSAMQEGAENIRDPNIILAQTGRDPFADIKRKLNEEITAAEQKKRQEQSALDKRKEYLDELRRETAPARDKMKKDMEEAWKKEKERNAPFAEADGTKNRVIAKPIDSLSANEVYIDWELERPSKNGGVIVQHIVRTAPDGKKYEFWELWPIEPNAKRPRRDLNYVGFDDQFRLDGEALPGIGHRQIIEGTAQFYEGLTAEDLQKNYGFKLGVPGAPVQLATTVDPKLPQDRATPPLRRPEHMILNPER